MIPAPIPISLRSFCLQASNIPLERMCRGEESLLAWINGAACITERGSGIGCGGRSHWNGARSCLRVHRRSGDLGLMFMMDILLAFPTFC